MKFDVSELRKLEQDLGSVSERAAKNVRATMQKAALNIKKDLQREAQGSQMFSGMPASISYETWEKRDEIAAEIGPEIGRRQGSLGWIAYEGYEGKATTPPRFPDPQGALDREADAFEAYLAAAIAGDFW